jgi:hypothetical protein
VVCGLSGFWSVGLEQEARAETGRSRVPELERTIGRQQVALDFFQKALRSWDAKRRSSAATISSVSSEK